MNQFTIDEVVTKLRELQPNPPFNSEYQDFGDMPIDEYMGDWDCFVSRRREKLSFFSWVKDFFAFDAHDSEWEPLMGDNATLTLLAQFVVQKAENESVEPVRILGKECDRAGLFFALRRNAERIVGRPLRASPSTRLCEIMDAVKLCRFVDRVGFFALHQDVRSYCLKPEGLGLTVWVILGVFQVLSGMFFWTLFSNLFAWLLISFIGGVLMAFFPLSVVALIRWHCGTSPPSIRDKGITFRNLVEFLMSPGPCARCGYDLRGNASGKCPECGTPLMTDQHRLLGRPD